VNHAYRGIDLLGVCRKEDSTRLRLQMRQAVVYIRIA
jgi:hypothetical protein